MGLNVFISHNSADGDWVQRTAEQIRSLGVEAYLYENDPQPGKLVSAKVQKAIDRSDMLIVFFTQHSHDAPYVHQEIGYAEAKGKLVIPLVENGAPQRALGMLDGREYIPFDLHAPEKATEALTAYLSRRRLEAVEMTERSIMIGIGSALLMIGVYMLYTTSE